MESPRSSRSSSPAEERRFLQSWNPDPLVPDVDVDNNQHLLNPHIVTSKAGKYIIVDGQKCLNFGTHNYLGLADDPRLEKSSIEAVRKYGVGSCGPRAFYGTMDVHLELEEELAQFLNLEEAVLYSFGFSTIASAIPAYAKATDIIFVDDACNFAIQQGMVASRSKIIRFKHNDVHDLRRRIEDLVKESNGRILKKRTFLVVEGIYAKTGDLCPLKELIELKNEYKIRFFIDESRSFGVLGSEGKGITQHFNVDINEVDLIMVSLENALCAYGGFCAGSSYVVDHQRLAGAGYCFSASLPPLQTRVALESLRIIKEDPTVVREAQEKFIYAHKLLNNLTSLKNISHESSPIKLLVLKRSLHEVEDNNPHHYKREERLLNSICEEIITEEHIAVSVARYLEDEEMGNPVASIRLIVSGCMIHGDIERAIGAIERFSRDTFSTEKTSEILENKT